MMTSKLSKILTDNKKQNSKQVINRNVSELWDDYKKFKAKVHAHNAKLEQFTLKVLKLSFFSNPVLRRCDNRPKSKYQKSRKTNVKGQLALIKKAISIHLRSLQIEQQLFQENQYLKQLLNDSYSIVIEEKKSPAIEIYEIKNVRVEEKCFKTGLEYILQELEAVSNKTKLKIITLEAGNDNDTTSRYINHGAVAENLKCLRALPHEATFTAINTGKKLNVISEDVDTEESQNFNLQIITENLKCSQTLPHEKDALTAENAGKKLNFISEDKRSQNFNLLINLDSPNLPFALTNIHQTINLNSFLKNISNHSLDSLVPDAKPVCAEEVLDRNNTKGKKEVVQKAVVAKAKVGPIIKRGFIGIDIRKKDYIKSWKSISTLLPNGPILNHIGLFLPLSFLLQKAFDYHNGTARKKCDKLILQKENACVELPLTSNSIELKGESVTSEKTNVILTEPEKGKCVSKDYPDESFNHIELKTVEFYDLPSNMEIDDYTASWVDNQNERDFYYLKPPVKMEDDTKFKEDQLFKRKSIMKKSLRKYEQDSYTNFKDYLKNIITYSEEFDLKRDSVSTIHSKKEKKKTRLSNAPSTIGSSASSSKRKNRTQNILEYAANYKRYKPPKLPDMNKTYQIVVQQNMPQGYSLQFVKNNEKDSGSTLIISNRLPTNNTSFAKSRFYRN